MGLVHVHDLLSDLLPQFRAEATLDGHTYSWPFLVDVTVQGWNAELVERAGLDPTSPPLTWDDYIANARSVVSSGVAPYGCTFDPRGWRSLVPITHSLTSDPYTPDGLFDLTDPAAMEALELMRRMVELSHPDVLEPEAALASINPDEAAFAAGTVAYLVKYQNAHVRFASGWPDPTRLQIAALPASGGRGGTVYWASGAVLLRYGKRKREATAYVETLTHDEPTVARIARDRTRRRGSARRVQIPPGLVEARSRLDRAMGVRRLLGTPHGAADSPPPSRGTAVHSESALLGGVPSRHRVECSTSPLPSDDCGARSGARSQRLVTANDL